MMPTEPLAHLDEMHALLTSDDEDDNETTMDETEKFLDELITNVVEYAAHTKGTLNDYREGTRKRQDNIQQASQHVLSQLENDHLLQQRSNEDSEKLKVVQNKTEEFSNKYHLMYQNIVPPKDTSDLTFNPQP